MSERAIQVLKSIHPDGFAFHGTNLARAKNIAKYGFTKDRSHGLDKLEHTHDYMLQPSYQGNNHGKFHKSFINCLDTAIVSYATRASTTDYAFDQNLSDSKIPALVIFKANPQVVYTNNPNICAHAYQRDDIPAQNIHGYIPIENINDPNYYRARREVLRKMIDLLQEKGVVNFKI